MHRAEHCAGFESLCWVHSWARALDSEPPLCDLRLRVPAGAEQKPCLQALERRDLGVLYLHSGLLREAKAELARFAACRGGLAVAVPREEDELLEQLLAMLAEVDAEGEGREPLTAGAWLRQDPPDPEQLEKLPLSW